MDTSNGAAQGGPSSAPANAALEENKRLQRENLRLTRELERQRSINTRNRISTEAKARLNRIISDEKSRLEQYMNLLMANCPDIILLFDREAKIVYASESYLKCSGAAAVGLIRGKTCRELLEPYAPETFLVRFEGLFAYALGTGQRTETEHEIDFGRGDGPRQYSIQCAPMLDEYGAAEGAFAIFYDRTDILRARDEAERAREAAEQSTRAKSDFLSRMSHEMRTPLNAIIGMTGIAQRAADAERAAYALTKVSEASQHLLGVINDILDISKIEADKLELHMDEFSFEKMLRRVVNVSGYRAGEKRLRLLVYLDQDIPGMLIGDDQRLAQVITNLLSNAIKFTDEGGSVSLNACLEWIRDGRCSIRVDVKDSGIGISAEQQSRLFANFEQADGSISRKYGGTGLGLAISKRIIELMGGEIWVDSEIGKGSTFSVRITAAQGRETLASPLGEAARLKDIRVLAADGAPETRAYFTDIMRRFRIRCDVAADGPEVRQRILGGGPYDICFIDERLPGADGVSLSRWIKERMPGGSVALMIPAAEWEAISAEATASGVDRFLSKPLFPSDIVDCINECLAPSAVGHGTADRAPKSFNGFRILLAEDVAVNREILLALLEPVGLTIDSVENGRQAMERFARAPGYYDLIFMDVQMPEMDGYEATRRIRGMDAPEAKTIPIIAMTANVFREDIERCLAAGMNAHVGKPIDLDSILALLPRYLNGGKGGARGTS